MGIGKQIKHYLEKDAAEIAYNKLNEENDKIRI